MRLLGALTLVAISLSCYASLDQLLPDEPQIPSGAAFNYSAWSLPETQLLQGVLEVTSVDSGRFTGTWEIDWAPGTDSSVVVGPQTGSGSLRGEVYDGRIYITMDRGDTTQSVRLYAIPDALGWRGRWLFVLPTGIRAGGTFIATSVH